MKRTPKILKFILNKYPPYMGAGIKVEYIGDDWRELHVSMSLHWYNRNVVGTHFGGSLYSMVDPHLMLLLMQLLGKGFTVWDKSANIEFIKASKTKVTARIKISDEELNEIIEKTKDGTKYFANFNIDIINSANELVARVQKVIYIRKKS